MNKEYILAALLIATALKIWTLIALYALYAKHEEISPDLAYKTVDKRAKR